MLAKTKDQNPTALFPAILLYKHMFDSPETLVYASSNATTTAPDQTN
jgi:hypothetical protein